MINTFDRLAVIRVAEVMNTDIVFVRDTDTMHSAAQRIHANCISGAPVIDRHGHCVGVLGISDFTTPTLRGDREPNEVWGDFVRTHMTSPAVSIAPTASLVDASRLMCTKHVHRLPVVDESGHLAGMISSLDVVGSLVAEANSRAMAEV